MAVSLDGRIVTRDWPMRETLLREYERIHRHYAAAAWLCGRTTMEPFARRLRSPEEVARTRVPTGARGDHAAPGAHETFAVAIDPRGKLAWETGEIDGDHVISLVSDTVSDEYLTLLRERGVSYLISPGEGIDLPLMLERLAARFGIDAIMLEGGGETNGAMLRAGLVDEVSLLIVPVADGRDDSGSLFGASGVATPTGLSLHAVEPLDSGIVWARYRIAG